MSDLIIVLDDYLFGKAYLSAAKKAGYRTFLVTSKLPVDQDTVDEYLVADLNDISGTAEAVLADPRSKSVKAVLPGHVYHVALQAKIAAKLGLPSISPEAASRCLNKENFRQTLLEHGVPQGWFFTVTRDQIDSAIAKATFPCVAKPVEGFASIGVMVSHTPDQLREALEGIFANASYDRSGRNLGEKVLIEEYFDGQEFSAETLAINGVTHIMGITGKYFDLEKSQFELGFLLPPQLSPQQVEVVTSYVVNVHRALGITQGPTHCEFRMTAAGPRVVEVNPRLGGGHLSELYEVAAGISLYSEVLNNALGNQARQSLPLKIDRPAGTGWVLGHEGVIEAVYGLEQLKNQRTVDMVIQRRWPGEKVPGKGDNRDRIVAFVASGKNLSEVSEKIAHAERMTIVQYQN